MTSLTQEVPARPRLRILRRPADSIRPASPRPQRRDCQGQLLAALGDMLGTSDRVEQATLRPWCSATFIGAQHRIILRLEADDAAQNANRLTAALRDAEFALRGHIVADVVVDEIRMDEQGVALVSLAVLTIEDW